MRSWTTWIRTTMRYAVTLAPLLCAPVGATAAALAFERVELAAHYSFPVYANHDLDGDLQSIEQIILVFHGLQRDGDAYFTAALALATSAHVDPRTTLVVAPNFFDRTDARTRSDLEGLPLWENTGWMQGDSAVVGPAVSSFAVVDDLLMRLADRTRSPRLTRIVVAGHSGGAQLVDRYAALNHVDERLHSLGIDVTYVVANPSSYLYFTPVRPAGAQFAPYSTGICPDYDRYRYGMQDMVPYAGAARGSDVFRVFGQRNVTFLWGTLDTDPNQRVLDKSCGAEAQGPSRYTRGHDFWRYEHQLDASGPPLRHQAFDVVGVGHNQSRMLGSACGAALLFGAEVRLEDAAPCVAVDTPG